MRREEQLYPVVDGIPRYWGKYRAVVLDNVDPLYMARLKVQLPAIPFDELPNWAMPCTPYAGSNEGFYFMPPIGANVWVEFESGDPHYPVWSGCYWPTAEDVPKKVGEENPNPIIKVLKTANFQLTLDDTADTGCLILNCSATSVKKEIEFKCDENGVKLVVMDSNGGDKATLTMNHDTGIVLEYPNGKITMEEATLKLELSSSSQTMVDKKVTIDTDDTIVTGNEEVDKDLVVKGDTTVNGNTTIKKDLSVSGKASITGATTISSNTTISGNLTVS